MRWILVCLLAGSIITLAGESQAPKQSRTPMEKGAFQEWIQGQLASLGSEQALKIYLIDLREEKKDEVTGITSLQFYLGYESKLTAFEDFIRRVSEVVPYVNVEKMTLSFRKRNPVGETKAPDGMVNGNLILSVPWQDGPLTRDQVAAKAVNPSHVQDLLSFLQQLPKPLKINHIQLKNESEMVLQGEESYPGEMARLLADNPLVQGIQNPTSKVQNSAAGQLTKFAIKFQLVI